MFACSNEGWRPTDGASANHNESGPRSAHARTQPDLRKDLLVPPALPAELCDDSAFPLDFSHGLQRAKRCRLFHAAAAHPSRSDPGQLCPGLESTPDRALFLE